MVTVVGSNLGLESVGVLPAIRGGSPLIGGPRRRSGSSRAGVRERLKGGGVKSIVRRWEERQLVDAVTFRATAADDVEQGEAVEEKPKEKEEKAAAPSSSDRQHQLSSREVSKISGIEQQQKKKQRKQAGSRSPRVLSNIIDEWVSREKGDVRDVVLMSLSFAVLVYISQHLVHAYCSLRHVYFNHY